MPGLYEIFENNVIYKMEIIWLSRLQRDLNFKASPTAVADWYEDLDETSKGQIQVRQPRKFNIKNPIRFKTK